MIPNNWPEGVNWRRIDNTMAKRKRIKRQTMIYKIGHWNLKIDQLVPHKNGCELMCYRRGSSPCSTWGNLRVCKGRPRNCYMNGLDNIYSCKSKPGKWEIMYVFVRCVYILPLSTIFLMNFGIALTVWYFFFSFYSIAQFVIFIV